MTFKLAILASGNGTDLDAVYQEMDAGRMPDIEVVLVLSDKEQAPVLAKAAMRNIQAEWVNPRKIDGSPREREEYDQELIERVKSVQPDLICLMGYMRILSPGFVRAFPRQIVNVHPALLPRYGGNGWYGMRVHEAVIAAGEKESGMTIHYVDFGVDSGATIMQEKILLDPGETPQTLKAKVQALEKKAYPEVIRQLAAAGNRWGGRVEEH